MLKRAERLGLKCLSGKPTDDRGYPQERDRARAEAKGVDYWARLHVRGDRREPLFFQARRKSHFDMPMAPVRRG
jgi:hypothetical protein